jgi:GT2 family glycosyltransferase
VKPISILFAFPRMPESTAIDISVCIPTVGRIDLLVEVLRSLEQQSGSFEVVVVCDGENASVRAFSESWCAPFPLNFVFSRENRGQAHARNLAAEKASGEILLFLDDDTVPAPGWLAAHRKHHRRDDKLVVLGRLQHTYPQPPHTELEQFMRKFADSVEVELQSVLAQMDAETARYRWVGLNSSVPKSAFMASGGFDVNLRHVQEDAELATRMADDGVKFVYEPGALIYHRSTKDLAQLHVSRASLFAQSDLYRLRKQQGVAKWPMLASLYRSRGAQKVKQRFAWHLPRAASAVGEFCRSMGEASGAQFFFRQWRDLSFSTRYWNTIRAEGLTLRSIRKMLV